MCVKCCSFFLYCSCSFELISVQSFCVCCFPLCSVSFVYLRPHVWCFQFCCCCCWCFLTARQIHSAAFGYRGRFNVSYFDLLTTFQLVWQNSNIDVRWTSVSSPCVCVCVCLNVHIICCGVYNFLRKCSVRLIMLLSLYEEKKNPTTHKRYRKLKM